MAANTCRAHQSGWSAVRRVATVAGGGGGVRAGEGASRGTQVADCSAMSRRRRRSSARRGGGFRGGGGGQIARAAGGRGGGGRGGGGRRSDITGSSIDVALLGYLDNGLGFYRFSYNGSDKRLCRGDNPGGAAGYAGGGRTRPRRLSAGVTTRSLRPEGRELQPLDQEREHTFRPRFKNQHLDCETQRGDQVS